MADFNKQLEYWKITALSDFETAEILIEKDKFLHGLFFCHLAIEKVLKAHFVKATKNLAPKTHDLIYLAKKTDIKLDEKHKNLLTVLMRYQLEGRYPENFPSNPDEEKLIEYLKQTKELLEWLVKQL